MTLHRASCVEWFERAVERCDPERLVARAKHEVVGPLANRTTYGLALGKAALKMARGAGPVVRGIVVTNADDGHGVPDGWHVIVSSHPLPDERSLHAGEMVVDLIAGATKDDLVIALISGGASALVEMPVPGVSLDELRARVAACMASGADIHAINRLRGELSAIKGGKLARMCDAPIATLAVSDVYDDDLAVIGSGPTYARRPRDRAAVIAPMRTFVEVINAEFPPRHNGFVPTPYRDDVERVAAALMNAKDMFELVAWGEPTVRIPDDHGEGGRAQQLALLLARELREWPQTSAFVIASDGVDGPAPAHRRAPAGALVDDKSWERIADEGIDPEQALIHRDAGTALDAIGALVVTGPTGINHGDVMVIG